MSTILAIGRAFAVIAVLTLAALVAPSTAHAQVLQCAADAPSGDAVANGLFTNLVKTLNVGWTKGAPSIDPLYPNDPDNPPGGKTFGTGTQHVSCTSEAYALCALDEFYPVCDHISASLSAYDLVGMSQFALTFKDVASTQQNPKSLATHSNRGPDAGLVTDGVFAADGATSWNDTTYAVIIPLEGPKYGVTVDLGAVVANICGASASCKGPLFQGDKNVYLLEYSSDGATWQCYGQFGVGSGSGLRTRGATSLSAQGCPATLPASFGARYLRVSAYSGDGNYSVSELQAHDTTSNLLTLLKAAVGPLPAQIVSGAPVKDSTAWNDKHAVVLASSGPAHALVVDLGAVKDVCGNAASCASGPIVQADRNTFSLEYSGDGYNWFPFGQFPYINSDGLHTRGLTGTPPGKVSGRYFRIWAVAGGNGDYSVAQLSLYDTTGATAAAALISVGSTVYGPEPYVTNGELPPDQSTDWNDPRYATVLRPCSTPNSTCPSSPPALPGLTAPLVVDLGSAFPVSQLTLQADRHSFQVDISSDRATWKPLYTFGIVSGESGLITRDSPAFTPVSGRYLRVYGVAGDDSNYSVSELDAFTAVANTPCSYQTPDPNAGQNFSCSYDGQYTYDLSPNAPVTLSYKVYKGAVDVVCTNGLATNTLRVATASKGAVCKADLSGPTSGSTTLTYPTGNFCAGTCQNGQAVLTYAQFPTQQDALPQFTASNMKCSIDSDFDKLVVGLFEGVAAEAMNTVLNSILGPRTGTPAGVTPFPASCALGTTAPVAPTAVSGRASPIGKGPGRGHVELRGRFVAPNDLALNHVTLALGRLLEEQGVGELVTAGSGESVLPLSLQPDPEGRSDAAVFATRRKAQPQIRMEVSRHRGGKQNAYDFALRLDGVTIREPEGCRRKAARLSTSFILAEGVGRDVAVNAEIDWRCHGKELQAK